MEQGQETGGRRAAGLLALAGVGLLAMACGADVQVGEPRFLDEPRAEIGAGASKGVALEVTNPDGAELQYSWAAAKGSFDSPTTRASTNMYQAPAEPGSDTITVAIDGGGSRIERVLQVGVTGTATLPPPPPPEFAYEFDGGIDGWVVSETAGTAGLVRLAHNETERLGAQGGSLQLDLDLAGGNPRNATAEAQVNLTQAGDVISDPLDLSVGAVVFHLKFPPGFPVNKNAPHGVQPFVRDHEHRHYYGCYQDVEATGKWMRVTFRPGLPTNRLACAASEYQQDAAFSPKTVTVLGIKVGANPAGANFKGPVFLDDVLLMR